MIAPLLAAALAAAPATGTEVTRTREPERRPLIGVAADLGVPSGAGASLLVRPLSWLRLHGGAGTNGASFGLHAGATLMPLRGFVTPTFTLEGGHFFEGDATNVAKYAANLPDFSNAEMLRTFSYDFASAHLGVEVGSQEGLFFYLRAGLSYLDARFGSFERELGGENEGITVNAGGPTMGSPIPSAALGVGFFL